MEKFFNGLLTYFPVFSWGKRPFYKEVSRRAQTGLPPDKVDNSLLTARTTRDLSRFIRGFIIFSLGSIQRGADVSDGVRRLFMCRPLIDGLSGNGGEVDGSGAKK